MFKMEFIRRSEFAQPFSAGLTGWLGAEEAVSGGHGKVDENHGTLAGLAVDFE